MRIFGLIPFIIALTMLTGCLSKENSRDEAPLKKLFGGDVVEGSFDSGDQQRVDFNLTHDNITDITFRIFVEDDDPNTEPDTVTRIEVAEHDTDGEEFIDYHFILDTPTSTPYEATYSFNFTNGILIDDEWQMYFYIDLGDGEDTWPGPIIYRGVRDTGFSYRVEIEYTYYPVSPYPNI